MRVTGDRIRSRSSESVGQPAMVTSAEEPSMASIFSTPSPTAKIEGSLLR
ncbi:hypothetical protein BH10ACT6_BH10ACT6_07600 [soil metagenome]